jgi:hypothetical protein
LPSREHLPIHFVLAHNKMQGKGNNSGLNGNIHGMCKHFKTLAIDSAGLAWMQMPL